MNTLDFIATGRMGDFIQALFAVKNICDKHKTDANIYITDKIDPFGGDIWNLGLEKAYQDIKDLIMQQPYINKFEILPDNFNGPYINLNNWRQGVYDDCIRDGYYSRSWSEFLSTEYKFIIPENYPWLQTRRDDDLKDTLVIHRSLHRHNPNFFWKGIINTYKAAERDILFLTCSQQEWDEFPFKEGVKLQLVSTISQMAVYINSCKLFIGNQSAPFALASALDVSRMVELDNEPGPFYMNETKYSRNIQWFLSMDKNSLKKL